MAVAVRIGALNVNDGDIRMQSRHGDDFTSRVWVHHRAVAGVDPRQVGGAGRVHGQERQAGRAGRQSGDHAEVRVLLPFQASVLHRRSQGTQRPDAGIAGVRKDDLAGAAGGDHLIVDQVRRSPCQRQVLTTLADDLMAGGERDEVGEAGGVDQIAIVDEGRHGFPQAGELGHRAEPPGRAWAEKLSIPWGFGAFFCGGAAGLRMPRATPVGMRLP